MFKLSVLAVVLAAAVGQAPDRDEEPKKYALLASINDYEHDALGKLECAEDDGKALADVLKQSGYEVDLLLGRQATKKAIEEKLNAFAGRGNRRGVVLIGFFGHGVQPADKSYFFPYDARQKVLKDANGRLLFDGQGKPQYEADTATLVSLDLALAALTLSPAGNRVLLADCCRNDPSAARGRDAGFGSNLTVDNLPPNCAVVLACEKGQRAFESRHDWGHGAFTKGLLDELGKFRKGGRPATMGALIDAMTPRVRSMVKRQLGQDQAPRPIYNGTADLQLAFSGWLERPEERPEPPPFPFTAKEAHEYSVKSGLWLGKSYSDIMGGDSKEIPVLGTLTASPDQTYGCILQVRLPKFVPHTETVIPSTFEKQIRIIDGRPVQAVVDVVKPVTRTYTRATGWDVAVFRTGKSELDIYDTLGRAVPAEDWKAVFSHETPVIIVKYSQGDSLCIPVMNYVKYFIRIPFEPAKSNRRNIVPAPVPIKPRN